MSLNYTQIQAAIHRTCKSTTVSYPTADLTADVNLGQDKVWAIIFNSNDTWQWDDTNNTTDYPIITTDLVSGQRDYAFLTDNDGNLILEIYKVTVKQPGGIYKEIYPVDVQSEENTEAFYDGVNTPGVPNRYDKTANGIFLDPIPNSSIYTNSADLTAGLKVYINREGYFFLTSDTTKKPGFSPLFHEYLVLFASYKYACRNQLKNKQDLYNDMVIMEVAIKKYYAKRQKDVVVRITAERVNSV